MKKLTGLLAGIIAITIGVFFIYQNKTDTLVLTPEEQCKTDLQQQKEYLESEKYSTSITFDKYSIIPETGFTLKGLDTNSSRYAAEFKTRLKEELDKTGVNFAGQYSLVYVGMTGWGQNYFIVDRRNGQAFEFPYHALSLEFKKDSNLIVMNSKESIQKLLSEQPEGGCYFLNQEKVSELRPFYFKWEKNILNQIAPSEITPPVNAFWIDYFSDIKEGTSEEVAYFIRESKERIIEHTGQVPHSEGYTGFMFINAFPGILPQDFAGISTPYGDYSVAQNGELQFMGNAPSNAGALSAENIAQLLGNISKRLSVLIKTKGDVDVIFQKISEVTENTQSTLSKRLTSIGTYTYCLPRNDNFSTEECIAGINVDGTYYF